MTVISPGQRQMGVLRQGVSHFDETLFTLFTLEICLGSSLLEDK